MIDRNKLLTINDEIEFLFHGNIVEYDMREASVQLSDRYNLLDKKTVERLKLLPKQKRVKEVGCIQRDTPGFTERFHQKLFDVRNQFIEDNNLSDNEIIGIHSDALFINTKKDINPIIDGITFVPKHHWSGYVRYNNIEMFYNDETSTIDYKNIPVEVLELHTIGMCTHIQKVFSLLDSFDESVLVYESRFQKAYLMNQLDEAFYIPFGKINGQPKIENLSFLSFLTKMSILEVKRWKRYSK